MIRRPPGFYLFSFFFFNDTATTEIYTLSLRDALPISRHGVERRGGHSRHRRAATRDLKEAGSKRHPLGDGAQVAQDGRGVLARSEEHTSELQSHQYVVCRLMVEI